MNFEETLIEKVKENDFLYNPYSKLYKNSIKRELVWSKIADDLGKSPEACKQRWKSLRDRFVRELKKENLPAGSAAVEFKGWQYFEQLSFLKDCLKLKTRKQSDDYEDHSISIDEECATQQNSSLADDQKFYNCIINQADNALNTFFSGLQNTLEKKLNSKATENELFFKLLENKMQALDAETQQDLQLNMLAMVNEALRKKNTQ